jgi:thiosulfate/3-mercaptopyruvate sulfurtransferase
LLKTYGQEKVGLMQGSLEEWMEAGGPTDEEPIEYNVWAKDLVNNVLPAETKYQVSETAKDRFVDMSQVLDMMGPSSSTTTATTIVDTRGSSFAKGHMPGAIHLPYSSLVEADNSLKFKPKQELEAILKEKQVPKDKPVLLSCGSAVSVCHMALVLEECGYQVPLVYDGSWNEWGSDPSTPKVVTTD